MESSKSAVGQISDLTLAMVELHKAIGNRLFAGSRWRASATEARHIDTLLERWGIEAILPECFQTVGLQCGLLRVFLGVLNEWDCVFELLTHDLIDEVEATWIERSLSVGEDADIVLRSIVQRAYCQYYSMPKGAN